RVGSQLAAHVMTILWVAAYCYGVVVEANGRLDFAQPHVYSATVLGRSAYRGRRNASYFLRLSAWGSAHEPTRVQFSRSLFYSVRLQQRICVALHPGALGMAWYTLDHCP